MTNDPYIGTTLANRYQIESLVGKGAMGRVYQAKDRLLGGVTIAVKFLSQALLNSKMRDRFEQEATICALLGEKSIHIVQVRDYGVDNNEIPFYVMEFLQGQSLSEIIRITPLGLPRFLSITRQICLGLQCAHKGIPVNGALCPIIHRDIKPSNMWVLQDPSLGELVKILDFGIAKLLQTDGEQTHSFMGTLSYCSPEQMEGKEELDSRSDIYSLGIMMFEMLTGQMPIVPETHTFGGWYKAHHEQHPRTFDSANPHLKLPKALDNLVMSCLEKLPQNRPQDVKEIIEALQPLEERYSPSRSLAQGIGNLLSVVPISSSPKPSSKDNRAEGRVQTPARTAESIEQACREAVWPKDKPQAKIVFPHLLKIKTEVVPTLWVMLEQQDIKNRHSSTRYNQFLFLPSPHPMVLWITALYNPLYGVRWLPCYLDLKTSIGIQTTAKLGETGSYHILFFATESKSQHCVNVMKSTIKSAQCKLLKEWTRTSGGFHGNPQPQVSKRFLMQELEKLKPKILKKLEAGNIDPSHAGDISG